jgi:hypothetical protein
MDHIIFVAAISALSLLIPLAIVVLVLPRVTGWTTLARHYQANGPFQGQTWCWQSLHLGGTAQFNNCVCFGVNEEGLYIRPQLLSHLGFPSLLIPWSDLHGEWKERRILGFRLRSLELWTAQVPHLRLRLEAKLGQRILQHLARHAAGTSELPAAQPAYGNQEHDLETEAESHRLQRERHLD